MAPSRKMRRRLGKKSALKFRLGMLPRLRGHGGACNIRVPAVRESEVINVAFVERLEAFAEQEDEINEEAGPGLHDHFVHQTPREMSILVRRLIQDFLECFTEPIERGEPDAYYTLCNTFDTLLYLIARGNISFGEESGIIFCKPAAAPPAPEMQREILARIRSDRPLHFLVLEILTELTIPDPEQKHPRPTPSTAPSSKPRTIHYPTEGFALDIANDHICIRATDYHTESLVLFWQELFDLAKGVGFDIPRGSPQ